MVSKIILVFASIIPAFIPSVVIFCQVALPTGGAIDVLRKQDFSVDLLSYLVGILAAVIVWQETQKKKKDGKIEALNKEMLDLTNNQLKDLQLKLMRYESSKGI